MSGPMTNDLKVQKRHDGGQLQYFIYLIHFSVSNLSVSLHLYVNIHLQLLTTSFNYPCNALCIKFGRSSYLVLHFPPLREFKDFPNTRQSKLSLCNGDVVQRHYRIKQCKLSFDLHKINSFQTFVDIIFLDILKLFYNSILNFDFKMGNVCQEFDRLIPKPFFIENLSNNSRVDSCMLYSIQIHTQVLECLKLTPYTSCEFGSYFLPTFYAHKFHTYLVLSKQVITILFTEIIINSNSKYNNSGNSQIINDFRIMVFDVANLELRLQDTIAITYMEVEMYKHRIIFHIQILKLVPI